MTAVQIYAEVLRELSTIVEDESLMTKVLKYIKKLTAKKPDPTLMTKEEFFARIDEAKKSPMHTMLPNESFEDFRKRVRQ